MYNKNNILTNYKNNNTNFSVEEIKPSLLLLLLLLLLSSGLWQDEDEDIIVIIPEEDDDNDADDFIISPVRPELPVKGAIATDDDDDVDDDDEDDEEGFFNETGVLDRVSTLYLDRMQQGYRLCIPWIEVKFVDTNDGFGPADDHSFAQASVLCLFLKRCKVLQSLMSCGIVSHIPGPPNRFIMSSSLRSYEKMFYLQKHTLKKASKMPLRAIVLLSYDKHIYPLPDYSNLFS
ncbi:hypothetical protein HELRODRAFT_167205 [Helobdella robusta]|uniref:Cadherin domain-containing protein n=1 Tax=Helobdella robusta TaxID=6412 RepID=T1EZ51_HELRO|nr:hypothetical protein HELRODRAFT_167205 [Helobdella robusta]ESO10710.1 hypothetical protein HELRODRAFT_167205 [Helobdella robusta]